MREKSVKRVVDITGEIREGMWNYEEPFPKFKMKPLGTVPWVDNEVYCEIFEGIHSQTGTYIETPAHFYGNDKCYLVSDILVDRLVNIPCVVIYIKDEEFENHDIRKPINVQMLEKYLEDRKIPEQAAILVGTGWSRHWMDKCYLDGSPYFTYDAMMWLINKKPFLLGTDFPRWENLQKPEGFFKDFFSADILMLAPCTNLDEAGNLNGKLTVLPLKIPGTSCVPCRAIVIED